jgi:Domain of unknown function (DUF4111)/Nucleotidyltransferase domain
MVTAILPDEARRRVDRYLRHVDRFLPGRVLGLYVVGSAALDAYRPGHSDLDVVAVTDGAFGADDLRRLRLVHVAAGAGSAARSLVRGRLRIPGTVNAVYVAAGDLSLPVTTIVPVASHVGHEFHAGRGFDVNPVVWSVLATRGIPVRGPDPASLGLDPQPGALRDWNLTNLQDYWAPWAVGVLARPRARRLGARWLVSWGVLGAPRLHCTIATGEVVSKEAAGEYALATFDDRWRPVIEEGLAYRTGGPSPGHFASLTARAHEAGRFVQEVVADARG